MIRLEKVNKYFNRHKKNEIHVINDVSLDLPTSGLVALLGESGSGKTTMLNAMGGLDSVKSGNIYIDGNRITRKTSYKIDKIRNLNVGYIFQDYKLVDSMTVFDNVALSLKLIGIKDKEEIKNRVLYTLDKVGMLRYKNRLVTMLSGGERQRVGIARALVKNPKIILADEPTGNLDSKNSLEVMNIIKSISSKYLVVLVTHEEELARFYADRIIEFQDGKVIKDYENKHDLSLNYEVENRIYLKDYNNIEKIKKDNLNIEVYREDTEELNIKIVFKNGNIYIDSDNKEKLEVVENNSNIELVNDHYKEIKKQDIKENNFDIESVSNNITPKYSSIFRLGSFVSYGFKKILDYPILKKILLGGFFLSGMFIFYAVSSISASLTVKDKDFININKEYLTIASKTFKVDDYLAYEKLDNINYILPTDSTINFKLDYTDFLQTSNYAGYLNGSLSDLNMIKKDDLVLGRMPQNDYELVIDKLAIERFIDTNRTKSVGIDTYDKLLNRTISLEILKDFKVVGITDLNEPNIYVNSNMFLDIISNSYNLDPKLFTEEKILNYELFTDKIKLTKGRMPSNDYEVIVSKNNEYTYELNKEIDLKVNNKKLKVVGYFEVLDNQNIDINNYYLANKNTIKYKFISKTDVITIYSSNKDNTIKYFKDKLMNIKDSYDYSKTKYLKSREDSIRNTLIASGIVLGISLVEILLMIRSSFMSRIKEVGIYRAIGIKKMDIYKMFTGEILSITVIGSIPGITFMAYILKVLREISYLESRYVVNLYVYLFSVVLVLVFNLVVGLIPVYTTIKSTPAKILARYDVD